MYRGNLDDQHFRAAARIALRAHGFVATGGNVAADHRQLGCYLRDKGIPECFPAFADLAEYRRLSETDPFLWSDRLVEPAAGGYREASVLHSLTPGSDGSRQEVALLGAAFMTGISVLDYAVDECGLGAPLYSMLRLKVLQKLFDRPEEGQAELERLYLEAEDPRLRLVILLVGSCVRCANELRQRSGNETAWSELGQLVARVFLAHRAVSTSSMEAGDELLPVAEAKSILPSLVFLQFSLLTQELAEAEIAALRGVAASIGRVFLEADDLADIRTDCARSAPSTAVLRLNALMATRGRDGASDADLYDVIEMGATKLVETLRPDALSHSRQAAPAPKTDLILFAHQVAEGLLEFEPMNIAESSQRISFPDPNAQAALHYLLTQQREGYSEAEQHLTIPRLTADGISFETHTALLFQRAVILDALLDARTTGLFVPDQVVSQELLLLLRGKHHELSGGWSMLPEVAEFPPDTDTLAAVLRVLFRGGGSSLASTCDEPIRLVLDGAGEGGELPPWILSPRIRTPLEQRVRSYAQLMGTQAAHPEVVANLLSALMQYDPMGYGKAVFRTVRFLEQAQHRSGAWLSKRYASPCYGTYRVLSVLGLVAADSPTVARAHTFLLETQHPNGSWGETGGDPLSTSLAMLALTVLGLPSSGRAIRTGREYLQATQQPDGAWSAAPGLTLPTPQGVVTCQSRSISTAYGLKALVATSTWTHGRSVGE